MSAAVVESDPRRSEDDGQACGLAARRAETTAQTRAQARAGMPAAKKAILAATERLLDRAGRHDEVSVTAIVAEAGVSRPTFYGYFASKQDVIAALYLTVIPTLSAAWRTLADRSPGQPPRAAIASGLARIATVWTEQRATLVTAVENRHLDTQIDRAHTQLIQQATRYIARQIEHDRGLGLAPPGPPIVPLTRTLIAATDHTYYLACLGTDPALPNPHTATTSLAAIWLGTLYTHPRHS